MIIKPAYTLSPRWPCPPGVNCWQTTRLGGVSTTGYSSANLGLHVADDACLVAKNRQAIAQRLQRSLSDFQWLEQVHGIDVVLADARSPQVQIGDALVLRDCSRIGAVMTADCLPVVLANRHGGEVAVVHGGWRGLAAGILQNTLLSLESPRHQLIAWLGPAIGLQQFVVGAEVRDAFCQSKPWLSRYFLPTTPAVPLNETAYFRVGLHAVARHLLLDLGVTACYQGFTQPWNASMWFSYRAQSVTGRMATLVALETCIIHRQLSSC